MLAFYIYTGKNSPLSFIVFKPVGRSGQAFQKSNSLRKLFMGLYLLERDS